MKTSATNRCSLLMALLACVSCRSDDHKYSPTPVHETADVEPVDLGVPTEQFPALGTKNFDMAKSTGRFPTGLSIVQIVAKADSDGAARHLQLAETPVERASYWNELLSDLPILREVRIQRAIALHPYSSRHVDLLRKSVKEDCGLCLIYAKVPSDNADAEYVAALWDAVHEKPLAAYRVPATIPDCKRAEAKDEEFPAPKRKLWLSEADFRAEADLRRMVHDTIWELVSRDDASATTQPNPWQTDHILFPRDSHLRIYEIPAQKDR